MTDQEKLIALKIVHEKAQTLRKELGISDSGEVTFKADLCDGEVVVLADGLGGATVMEVEGNFPIDYYTRREQQCETESEASSLAEKWMGWEDEEEGEEEDG